MARVIDVVSINGQSLLPVIYIFTRDDGTISWCLLGCPCLEANLGCANAANGAPLNTHGQIFGAHKAPQMVRTVHALEHSYAMHRDDRAVRLVLSVADQAIQGPGSIHFTAHERDVDALPGDALSEGICKFHIVDGVGDSVDRHYQETVLYDRLLRLLRRQFAFGTGKLILRACADKFSNMAKQFDATADKHRVQVAQAEANGQLIAAERARRNATRAEAEAAALRRAGWTRWRTPLAPRADGTRKVVWQAFSRDVFFYIYGLFFWSIQARMQQSLENTRCQAEKQGRVITSATGLRTKEMRAWRSLGRAMLDIRILVFNLGRVDFRRAHLRAYALEVQSSITACPTHSTPLVAHEMLVAVGTLVEMRGIVLFIESLLRGCSLISRNGKWFISNEIKMHNPRAVVPQSSSLWLTSKTLLAHRCWRKFPSLALKLTEVLLGGTFRGVPLQGHVFDEPAKEGLANGRNEAGGRDALRVAIAARRGERFHFVLLSLDRLIEWCKAERREFMTRLLKVPPRPPRKALFAQSPDLPHVPETISCESMGAINFEQGEASEQEDNDLINDRFQSSFAPPMRPRQPHPTKDSTVDASEHNAFLADLLSDAINADPKTMQDAAVFLAESCAQMSRPRDHLGLPKLAQDELLKLAKQASSFTDCDGVQAVVEEDSEAEVEDADTPFTEAADCPDQVMAGSTGPPPQARGSPSQPMAGSTHLDQKIFGSLTRREFHSLPRHTWIIGKNLKKNMWTIVKESVYKNAAKRHIESHVDPRTSFLIHAETLFGHNLLKPLGHDAILLALTAVHKICCGRFWALSAEEPTVFHKIMFKVQPPSEIYEATSVKALALQYQSLSSWLRSVEHMPFGHEYFVLQSLTLCKIDGETCFQATLKDVRDASRWPPRYIPRVGTHISSFRHGLCVVRDVQKTTI